MRKCFISIYHSCFKWFSFFQFQSKSASYAYFLPRIIRDLHNILYTYKQNMSPVVLMALSGLISSEFTSGGEFLHERKELGIFIKTSAPSPKISQTDVSELELFSGITLKQFSKASLAEWITRNTKLMLTYLDLNYLFPVVDKMVIILKFLI